MVLRELQPCSCPLCAHVPPGEQACGYLWMVLSYAERPGLESPQSSCSLPSASSHGVVLFGEFLPLPG